MRIVSREEFLTMPAGTVFAEFDKHSASAVHSSLGPLQVKGEILGVNEQASDDFLSTGPIHDSYSIRDVWKSNGEDLPLRVSDSETSSHAFRNDLFAVYSTTDVAKMVGQLARLLPRKVAR